MCIVERPGGRIIFSLRTVSGKDSPGCAVPAGSVASTVDANIRQLLQSVAKCCKVFQTVPKCRIQ